VRCFLVRKKVSALGRCCWFCSLIGCGIWEGEGEKTPSVREDADTSPGSPGEAED